MKENENENHNLLANTPRSNIIEIENGIHTASTQNDCRMDL